MCNLTVDEISKICGECAEVYASVYGNRKYAILPASSSEGHVCQKRFINFGVAIKDNVKVWIRKCPADPPFYISEGNKKGWVFVFVPTNSSSTGEQQLQFAVHLGVFKELQDA